MLDLFYTAIYRGFKVVLLVNGVVIRMHWLYGFK